MEIKFINSPDNTKMFKDLSIGDVFKYDNELYLLAGIWRVNTMDKIAINLINNYSMQFDPSTKVTIVNAELKVWE